MNLLEVVRPFLWLTDEWMVAGLTDGCDLLQVDNPAAQAVTGNQETRMFLSFGTYKHGLKFR